MKLSAALLKKELSALFEVHSEEKLSCDPVLGRPQFLQAGSLPAPNTLHLSLGAAQASRFPVPSGSLVLEVLPELPAGVPPRQTLLIRSASPGAVYNALEQIFERYDSWYSDLMESRLQGQSIQTLLELSYPLLQSPLVVVGMDFSVIAAVRGEEVMMPRGVFGSTEETYNAITTLKQDKAYSDCLELDGYFYYRAPVDGYNSLCVNIKKYGRTSFRLLMLDLENTQDLSAGFLLQMLAGLIEHALLHNTAPLSREDTTLRTILHTAISDRTADYVTISQQLDSAGWHSGDEYLCIVLQLSYLDQKNLTVHSICSYIENIISGACAFQFRDDIVVFLDLTISCMSQEDIAARLSFFVRDSLLRAGYSRVLLGHFNLRRQYDQALIALDMGSRRNPSFWIHRFNDIAFDYILEQATRKLPGYMISHEKLLELKYSDERNGTEYLRTLRLYLDNHLNAVQTARDLFVHRSTFLYRLERIRTILGTDFSNPDEVLYLMLSFRFIDQEERRLSNQ